MTNFTFDSTIPATNNNPSVDQPNMLINNASTEGILAIDHTSFNADNGGTHLQMHLPVFINPAPAVINGTATQGSVIYPAAGTADTSRAQLFYKNNRNIPYLVNAIKAWAIFNGTTGAIIASQSSNIASIVKNSMGYFTITLTANTVTGTTFAVLVTNALTTAAGQAICTYTLTGAGIFEIYCTGLNEVAKDTASISFIVIQI